MPSQTDADAGKGPVKVDVHRPVSIQTAVHRAEEMVEAITRAELGAGKAIGDASERAKVGNSHGARLRSTMGIVVRRNETGIAAHRLADELTRCVMRRLHFLSTK